MFKNVLFHSCGHRVTGILLCALLGACGGGGGGGENTSAASSAGTPGTPVAGAPSPSGNSAAPAITSPSLPNSGDVSGSGSTIGITAESPQVTAGGGGIRIQVSGIAPDAAVQWSLKPGDPGNLENTTGAIVTYNPPPANSIVADTTVSIIAQVGDALATARLLLIARTPQENESPANPPPALFAITAQSERAVAGGAPVTLTASKPASSGTVTWSLDQGNPGTLDRTGGDSVQYIPPAAGSIVDELDITINASLGTQTRKTTIVLEGAQGLSLFAGNDGGMGSRDGVGTAARFYNPVDIAIDAQGNRYIADTWNRNIRKIAPDGTVTTFAGSPYDPFSGSIDGMGTSARFTNPQGIAVDSNNNIYVADGKAIRKITPAGSVTTLAGNADVAGSVDGVGEQARFNAPYRIAVDTAGNLFVTDLGSVRKITPLGAVSTVARTDRGGFPPSQMLNAVRGIAVDRSGDLYVVDAYDQNSARDISYASSSIRRITPDGTVTTFAGVQGTLPVTEGATGSRDGTGTDARFNYPDGITIDASGNLYVTDTGNRTIRKISPTAVVTTIAGTAGLSGSADGNGAAARFLAPQGVSIDSEGNLYVADAFNHAIRQIAANGDVITIAGKPANFGSRDGAGATALFWSPAGIAADGQGNTYIADQANHTIRQISRAGEVSTIAGTPGQRGSTDGTASAARFNRPGDVAADANGNLYVADTDNALVRKITPAGVVSTLTEYSAETIAVDATGTVYVANEGSATVRRIAPSGTVTDISLLIAPEIHIAITDIAVDAAGNLYATTFNGIRKRSPAGDISFVGPQTPSSSAVLVPAPSLAIDQEGNLYSNGQGGALYRTTPAGNVTQIFDLEPLGFASRNGGGKRLEMMGPKTIAITVNNGVYLLRLP